MNNIGTTIEIVYMSISIFIYIKIFVDWYIDYRIDKKEKDNKKNRCSSCKD